ncbi:hypothetical protein FIBSPDRAFT_870598 [Athelia psychrophila]|uniref:Ankyrin n=1 Tax=Athelia psychrophila TaxID=1759441 RepID=A0A166AYV8_9AGAM|nr:hypothetical protein FIBSPDRAFT_870598 [Fibularhizoctonia sp. CBS 109695]
MSQSSEDLVPGPTSDEESDEEEFVYPGTAAPAEVESEDPVSVPATPAQSHPSPAQLESLYAAASSGDLLQLQKLFRTALQTGNVENFALANDASSRTGLTALHAAASRGYLDIVKWLVEDCGAIPDLEDKEGETALHKAALNGHLPILAYLLPDRADVHARDADGWTALHNACSKGYLDIVRWLFDSGGAAAEFDGAPGVDVRSKGGWTPLMNAASKGHLPIVLYLLNKQSANPLVRNNWGETAYDAAAAVFEVWICEVLQKYEAERWRGTTVSYDPLAVHMTVPLILYEHQRLDMRFKTLAVSSGRPRFSASGLGKHGRRAPFELKLLTPNEDGARQVATWRSDVQLPLRENPWALPESGTSPDGVERSHFWLSDWTLDVTHPGVDAEEGWQYAHSFAAPDEEWAAEQPAALERLLSGSGAMTAGLTSPSRNNSRGSSGSSNTNSQVWVRRRRWVRVMRRRLDIPPLPFLAQDGAMYHLGVDGVMIPYEEESMSDGWDGAQELGAMPSTMLSSAQDYVARARYLVGNQSRDEGGDGEAPSAVDARRAIAKLERATTELRQGLLSDDDSERKTQAEVLLNTYSRELERRRLAAGALGLLFSGDDDDAAEDDDGDSSDEEFQFHYPGSSPTGTMRAPSIRSSTTDYFSRPSNSRTPTDLTPQLSQAPEFRVPTHEAPQKVLTPRWMAPTPHQINAQWERDEHVHQCRDCRRRFNFLTRRHCRRCGRIFCDRCSSHRALLDPSDIVHDPAFPEPISSGSSHRVCGSCFDEVNAPVPNGLRAARGASMERIVVDSQHLMIPGHLSRSQSSSIISDLAECPVCNSGLADLGDASDQEAHVKNCLEGGGGTPNTPQAAKYLVYKLPAESTLVGVECVICLEEFMKGSQVARLSCLCSFHNACLSSWLQRGRSCPVHAR